MAAYINQGTDYTFVSIHVCLFQNLCAYMSNYLCTCMSLCVAMRNAYV